MAAARWASGRKEKGTVLTRPRQPPFPWVRQVLMHHNHCIFILFPYIYLSAITSLVQGRKREIRKMTNTDKNLEKLNEVFSSLPIIVLHAFLHDCHAHVTVSLL